MIKDRKQEMLCNVNSVETRWGLVILQVKQISAEGHLSIKRDRKYLIRSCFYAAMVFHILFITNRVDFLKGSPPLGEKYLNSNPKQSKLSTSVLHYPKTKAASNSFHKLSASLKLQSVAGSCTEHITDCYV